MPTYTTGYQNNQRLRVVVDITTNHSSNSSTVRVRQYQDQSGIGHVASDSWEMFNSLDGSTLHNSTQYRRIDQTTLISDNTRTISHANNGQRTVRVLARSWTHATSLFRQEIDQTITLTTIDTKPKALAAPSLSYSGGDITVTAPVASAPAPIMNYQSRRRERLGNGSWSSWTHLTISSSRVELVTPAAEHSYQFQSRASTAGGWGPWGSTASFLRPTVTTAPTVSRSGRTVTVTAPSVSGATQYQNRRIVEGGTWFNLPASSSRVDEITFAAGDQVRVASRAANANGFGPFGPSRSLTIPNRPSAPSSVSLSADVRDLAASWPQPSNGGDAITHYETQIRNVTTGGGWADLRDTGLTRSVTYTDLQPGSEYEIRARAVNPVGAGDWRVSAPIRINAYGNRRTTSGWVPVSHAYRCTSTGWVPISRIRRWTGTAWVDVT